MRYRSDRELSPLVAEDIHHQEDQYSDNALASAESGLYLVDAAAGGPEYLEADLCGMTLGSIVCGIKSAEKRSSSKVR
jgi:hypothetical protein